jgi:hypothetical protein
MDDSLIISQALDWTGPRSVASRREARANRSGLKFHHFGLAVRNPRDAFVYLEALGYAISSTVYDPLQSVNLALCSHHEMPDVEVVWPGEEPSPIETMIKRRSGLIYHLCYVAEDPEQAVAAIERAGLNVVSASVPKAAVLFGGREVSFFFIENVGLIEIIHDTPMTGSVVPESSHEWNEFADMES